MATKVVIQIPDPSDRPREYAGEPTFLTCIVDLNTPLSGAQTLEAVIQDRLGTTIVSKAEFDKTPIPGTEDKKWGLTARLSDAHHATLREMRTKVVVKIVDDMTDVDRDEIVLRRWKQVAGDSQLLTAAPDGAEVAPPAPTTGPSLTFNAIALEILSPVGGQTVSRQFTAIGTASPVPASRSGKVLDANGDVLATGTFGAQGQFSEWWSCSFNVPGSGAATVTLQVSVSTSSGVTTTKTKIINLQA